MAKLPKSYFRAPNSKHNYMKTQTQYQILKDILQNIKLILFFGGFSLYKTCLRTAARDKVCSEQVASKPSSTNGKTTTNKPKPAFPFISC